MHKKGFRSAVLVILMFFPTLISFSQLSREQFIVPELELALVPREMQLSGAKISQNDLNYRTDVENITGIAFNSMIALRAPLYENFSGTIEFHYEITPIADSLNTSGELYLNTLISKSVSKSGPFYNESFNVIIDFSEHDIMPGQYLIEVYYYAFDILSSPKISNSVQYTINVEKDLVHFEPTTTDPTREGMLSMTKRSDGMGYDHHWDAILLNSLNKPVSGNVSLLLTQKTIDGYPILPVANYSVGDDGLISYTKTKRSRYTTLMRGAISYDGSHSLFYRSSTSEIEDCELKLPNVSDIDDPPTIPSEQQYNGTDMEYFDPYLFKTVSELKYHTGFSYSERTWTPEIISQTALHFDRDTEHTFLSMGVEDTLNNEVIASLSSPIITYRGTFADSASFSLEYELVKSVVSSEDLNGIHASVIMEVYRDGEFISQETAFNGFYNLQSGQNHGPKNIQLDLTEHFTRAGQVFQVVISSTFTFTSECDDLITLKLDDATLNAKHEPTYALAEGFENGLNEFASESSASSELLAWDEDHPYSLGQEILTYNNTSGLVLNPGFDSDFNADLSWNASSGIFSEQADALIFNPEETNNMAPFWSNNECQFNLTNSDQQDYGRIEADFIPVIYDNINTRGRLSVYFTLDFNDFDNSWLEPGDEVRFIITLDSKTNQTILLDSQWQSQGLESWVQDSMSSMYPRYLRYYKGLSLDDSLTLSEIMAVDERLSNSIYPLEVISPDYLLFNQEYRLSVNLIKNGWNDDPLSDLDIFAIAMDNIDISMDVLSDSMGENGFGLILNSVNAETVSYGEMMLLERITQHDLDMFDGGVLESEQNKASLNVDFDIISLLDALQSFEYSSGSLQCEINLLAETSGNADITLDEEIVFDSWLGYHQKDLKLDKKYVKNLGSLWYQLDPLTRTIDIPDQTDYFQLSSSEQRELFNELYSLLDDHYHVYVVLNVKMESLEFDDDAITNQISMVFNELGIELNWLNGSGYQAQLYAFNQQENPLLFIEKTTKSADLQLLSDLGITIEEREDFISASTTSPAYHPLVTDGQYQYYSPNGLPSLTTSTPSEVLNHYNLRLSDCIGVIDVNDELMIDGPRLTGKIGLNSRNIITNDVGSYALRGIVDLYPFYTFKSGENVDKLVEEFKNENIKVVLQLYNQYGTRVQSIDSQVIKMNEFEDCDFTFSLDGEGNKIYHHSTPITLYFNGEDIVTDTDYLYFELFVELESDYYLTGEDVEFINEFGCWIDGIVLEFIHDEIIPEFTNLQSGDTLSDVEEISMRVLGNDVVNATLWLSKEGSGPYLMGNITEFAFNGKYSTGTFTFDTVGLGLEDGSSYEFTLKVINDKGMTGEAKISGITILNSPPSITCLVEERVENAWDLINTTQDINSFLKFTTLNNNPYYNPDAINYFFSNNVPTIQNREEWIKISEVGSDDQFSYIMDVDDIPPGAWHVVACAFMDTPFETFDVFDHQIIVAEQSLSLEMEDKVSTQSTVSVSIPDDIEDHVSSVSFEVKSSFETNWTLLKEDVIAPFSTSLAGLPWGDSMLFDMKASIKMNYPLFGEVNQTLLKEHVKLDLTGPNIFISQNDTSELYQIKQGGGAWTTSESFDGAISGGLYATESSISEDWWNDLWTYRIPVECNPNGHVQENAPVELLVDFTNILENLGINDKEFNLDSIRVIEQLSNGSLIEVPSQFDPYEDYNASSQAIGDLVWIMEGNTNASQIRDYFIYFDTMDNSLISAANYDIIRLWHETYAK